MGAMHGMNHMNDMNDANDMNDMNDMMIRMSRMRVIKPTKDGLHEMDEMNEMNEINEINEMNEMNDMNDMNEMNEMHDCLIAGCSKDCFPRRTPRFPNSPIPPTPKATNCWNWTVQGLAGCHFGALKIKVLWRRWVGRSGWQKLDKAKTETDPQFGERGPVAVLFFYFEWGKARIRGNFTRFFVPLQTHR